MELGLFPLHLVLFPGRPQPLHVFEPRYRQLLADCLDGDGRFGVVAIRNGAEVGDVPEVYDVGTVAELTKVEKLPDGRANIVARGVERFRITELHHDAPYLRAGVTPLDDGHVSAAGRRCAGAVRSALLWYLAELGAPDELLARVPVDPQPLSWLAASALQVEVPEQQRLLELGGCEERLYEALRILRREHGLMRHVGSTGSLRPAGPVGAQLN